MELTSNTFPCSERSTIWPQSWSDSTNLAILLLLALGIRGWVLHTTEVPARDSIGFIRYALLFEKENWQHVLRVTHQHPGYPLALMVTSWPIRSWFGETNSFTMQLSAQVVSALAGIFIVFPMFYIGKYLFNRTVGFWGALWFQCLPESGHVLSDAISDPLFLLIMSCGILFAMWAVQGKSRCMFALTGFFSGLAYLVRPEGLILLPATGAVLISMQMVPKWRRPWKQMTAFALVMGATAAILCSPYIYATGHITNKPSANHLMGQLEGQFSQAAPELNSHPQPALLASLFGVHINTNAPYSRRTKQAVTALFGEFVHAYQYLGWFPALLGLWWCRDRYANLPGTWVGVFLMFIQVSLVLWLAVAVGYASGRHILLLIICSIFQATAVLLQAPYRFHNLLLSLSPPKLRALSPPWLGQLSHWSLALLVCIVLLGLSKTIQPLHSNRAGHHAAGEWLAVNSLPADIIHDDHCWAHFYAGRVFLEGKTIPLPPGQTRHCYYVVSRRGEGREATTPREYEETDLAARGGKIVFHWPEDVTPSDAQVVIYQVSLF